MIYFQCPHPLYQNTTCTARDNWKAQNQADTTIPPELSRCTNSLASTQSPFVAKYLPSTGNCFNNLNFSNPFSCCRSDIIQFFSRCTIKNGSSHLLSFPAAVIHSKYITYTKHYQSTSPMVQSIKVQENPRLKHNGRKYQTD